MKKVILLLLVQLSATPGFNPLLGQAQEAQQVLLNVEKLAQLKQILHDMKSGYQIISSGYNTIKEISEGNFNLHHHFLNSLLEVSPAVRKYKRIRDIINFQLQIVKECKTAYGVFKGSDQFGPQELQYLGSVYSNLLQQSLRNLNALGVVLTPGSLRMSDGERLQLIDQICDNMQDQFSFLRQFNSHNQILALQRTKEKSDVRTMKSLYSLTK